jgi:hypothetical protein
MSIIQIVLVVFALSVVVRTGLRYSAGALSVGELLLWDGLWFAVAIFVTFPWLTQAAARILGVGRGADAVLYFSSVGLSYGFFRMYLRIRRLEQELTAVVRAMALDQVGPAAGSR